MAVNKQLPTCTLCLEVFRKPKILPCFHTYCEECLKNLAPRHGGRQFPCPSCRKIIPIPRQGVGAFQTNFYIDSEELGKTRSKSVCKTHPDNELVSVCTSCDLAICVECMLGEHKPHDIVTMAKAAVLSKHQLSKDKLRLQKCVERMRTLEENSKQNQRMLKDRMETAKTDIQTRCAQLVSLAKKQRDAELAKLKTVAKELDCSEKDSTEISSLHESRAALTRMEQEIDETLMRGNNLQLVTLAREMHTGRGSQQTLQAMLPNDWPQKGFVCPTLHAECAPDDMSRVVSAFVGFVKTSSVTQIRSDMYLFEAIWCPRRDIYSLSVFENGDVCVSFERDDVPLRRFNKHGLLIDIVGEITGKVAFQRSSGGDCFYIVPDSGRLACAKSKHFVLKCDLSGHGEVKKVEVKSKLTCISEWIPVFTISCTSCLAFDVNDSETQFAVLGDTQTDRGGPVTRTLTVFQKPDPNPIHSFCFKSFQLSDVCFYKTAEGKEVLLLADETHNSIHAFCVERGVLSTPLSRADVLAQPTALATDAEGSVWIGCRDGRIFKCPSLMID